MGTAYAGHPGSSSVKQPKYKNGKMKYGQKHQMLFWEYIDSLIVCPKQT
jgi:hypothetical protein